jgi:hypothetical protein
LHKWKSIKYELRDIYKKKIFSPNIIENYYQGRLEFIGRVLLSQRIKRFFTYAYQKSQNALNKDIYNRLRIVEQLCKLFLWLCSLKI